MRVVTGSPRRVATVTNRTTLTARPADTGETGSWLLFPTVGAPNPPADVDFDGPMLFEYLENGEFAAPEDAFLDKYAAHPVVDPQWASIVAASPDGNWVIGHGVVGAAIDTAFYERRAENRFELVEVVGGPTFVTAIATAKNPGRVQSGASNAMTTTPDGITWVALSYNNSNGVIVYRCIPGLEGADGFSEYMHLDLPAGVDGPYCFAWHPTQPAPGEPPTLAVGLGDTSVGAAAIDVLLMIVQPFEGGAAWQTIGYGDAIAQASYSAIQFRAYSIAWSPSGDQIAAFVKYSRGAGFEVVAGNPELSRLTFWRWQEDEQTLTLQGSSMGSIATEPDGGTLVFPTAWAWSKNDEIGYLQWCTSHEGEKSTVIAVGYNNWNPVGGFRLHIGSTVMSSVDPFEPEEHTKMWLPFQGDAAIEPLTDNEVLIAHGTGDVFSVYSILDEPGGEDQVFHVGDSAVLHDAMAAHVAAGGDEVTFSQDEGLVVVRSTAVVPRATSTITGQRQRLTAP